MPTRQFVVPLTSPATPADWVLSASLEIIPRLAYAKFNGAAAAGPYRPVLRIISDSGHVAAECVSEIIVAAGGSADVSWFPGADLDEQAAGATTGVVLEQLLYDTRTTGITAATVLASGVTYLVTVQGTWNLWNLSDDTGTPNADAMFPTTGPPARVSTQVGLDAETVFAAPSSHPQAFGHQSLFQLNLGGGYSHVEPQGGPYNAAQPNYLYRYTVTGQGAAPSFRVNDTPGAFTDNYGNLQVTIYSLSGSGSGGGGGALIPPGGADYAVLQPLAGVYVWNAAIDGGSA